MTANLSRATVRRHHAITAMVVLPLLLGACGGTSGSQAGSHESSQSPLASTSPSAPPAQFPTAAFAAIGEHRVPDERAAELQAILVKAAGGHGVTATVMSASGTWTGAVGQADQHHRMRPDAQMAIGSVTKTIVAAQVMRLVEAGEVSLDDPVADHVPAWVDIDTNHATIRNLLAMRSGIPDYVGDEVPQGTPPDRAQGETWRDALERVGPPVAPPGETFEYSNTNYLLLGLVIEHVRGRPLAEVLRSDVLAGEGLDRLILQPDERPSQPMAMPFEEPGALEEGGGYLPSFAAISGAGGAGAMASDSATLARWWVRLCGGQIVTQASLDEMTAFREEDARYGLGLMDEDGGSRPAIGHEGLQDGFAAWATCLYEEGIVITVLTNEQELLTGEVAQALAEPAADWD